MVTAEVETKLTGFTRAAVESLSAAKNEPDWVRDWRLAAWETFERLDWPKRTDEEWRRTDFKALKLDRLAPFTGAGESVVSLDGLLTVAEQGGVSSESERAGVSVQRNAS